MEHRYVPGTIYMVNSYVFGAYTTYIENIAVLKLKQMMILLAFNDILITVKSSKYDN